MNVNNEYKELNTNDVVKLVDINEGFVILEPIVGCEGYILFSADDEKSNSLFKENCFMLYKELFERNFSLVSI